MSDRREEAVLIVGTGALAGLFAGELSAAGIPVILLGSWRDGVRAIRQRGLRLIREDGRLTAHPVPVASSPVGLGPFRQALVLRKSWQTPRAARELAQCLAEDGVALTLQNGLGNAEVLARELGPSRVGVGVTTTPARVVSPGVVAATGHGTISLEDRPELGPLIDMLRQAGFKVGCRANMTSLLWGKLVVSAAINPLTALLGVRNGELLEDPAARDLTRKIGDETSAVAGRLGVRLPYGDATAAIEMVARQTAGNHSSMLQDVLRGAPTEIDAICGAIVREGRRAGAPTPLNRALLHLVQTSSRAEKRPAVSAG